MDVKVTPKFDRDYQQTLWTVECPEKRPDPFFVVPNPVGHTGYIVRVKTGELPASLEGTFLRHATAIDRIKSYYIAMQPTQAAKRKSKEAS